MNPPKAERNARLLARRGEGITYAELGREFGVCVQRAHVICREEAQRQLTARMRQSAGVRTVEAVREAQRRMNHAWNEHIQTLGGATPRRPAASSPSVVSCGPRVVTPALGSSE